MIRYQQHEGVTGRVQRWVKWTLEDQAVEVSADKETPVWLKVTKSRQLRRFSWDGEPLELSSEHSASGSSCHMS